MSRPIHNPFTQAWIQSLMQAAEVPASRTIRSKIEWIDILSQDRPNQDRMTAASDLWNYCQSEGLLELLKIVPTSQPIWQFSRDDIFSFRRRQDSSAHNLSNLESWIHAIGLQPATFELTAEVTAQDWTELVRNEAVRLKQSLNTAAVGQSSIKHLPCTARWSNNLWSVQFDQIDWIIVHYEDYVSVPRPQLELCDEPISWAIANAHESILTKSGGANDFRIEKSDWMDCVERLKPVHQLVLGNSSDFSPWFNRAWDCVWPTIYREQNLLNGKADINWIRSEMKACVTAQPRLTVWMFMFAKLICQFMVGRGLGQCADFVDR